MLFKMACILIGDAVGIRKDATCPYNGYIKIIILVINDGILLLDVIFFSTAAKQSMDVKSVSCVPIEVRWPPAVLL